MKEKSEIRDKKEQNAMQQLAQRMRNMSVAETTKGSTSSGNDEDEEATDNEIINTWHMHL